MLSSPGASSSKRKSSKNSINSTQKKRAYDERFQLQFSEDEGGGSDDENPDDGEVFLDEDEDDEDEEEEEFEDGEEDDYDDDDLSQTIGLTGELAPLSAEALAEFEAKQAKAGIVYISRIPPAMRPSKVRHLMSGFGAVGRVYLQQEDPKRAYLRRKHTSTKKAHFTEGWVEFLDKRVGRAVAEMLNGQPIGGKKGTRFRDDVWTMKYLPKFKWNMLTEQIAHETASHAARLRVELSQSRTEQKDYLKNVELARVLAKRAERKRAQLDTKGDTGVSSAAIPTATAKKPSQSTGAPEASSTTRPEKREKKRRRTEKTLGTKNDTAIEDILSSVF